MQTAITNPYAMEHGFEFSEETIGRFTEFSGAIDKLMLEGTRNVICGEN